MSQTILARGADLKNFNQLRVGDDVLRYVAQTRRQFEKEFEDIMGYESPLIQQMSVQDWKEVFPQMSAVSQAYAMPAVAVTTFAAMISKIEGFEHLYLGKNSCPSSIYMFEFQPDPDMFTIKNPLSRARLEKMDSQYAEYIFHRDPHARGDVYQFIDQTRSAPDELSKAYMAGLITTTSVVRRIARCSQFDTWVLGMLFVK